MLYEGKVGRLNYWLPQDKEIGGNVHFRFPNSNKIRSNIHKRCGIIQALEPDYYTGGTIITVDNLSVARMINYEKPSCVKCNGLLTSIDFLKRNRFGMYGRSSDCLMVAIVTEEIAIMLHVSAESLNNGILLSLPLNLRGAQAIMGPCISKNNYPLSDEYIEKRTKNYKTLGYDSFCSEEGTGSNRQLFIDIKSITKAVLQEKGIDILFSDERCTFDETSLGSHRRKGEVPKANPLYIW